FRRSSAAPATTSNVIFLQKSAKCKENRTFMLLNYEFSANLMKTAATALSDAANARGEACRDWANGSVMIDLAGQRIVVTGAAGGIGTAMVEVLTGFGAMVVACDIDGADLALPGVAEAHHFDLMDDAAIEAAAAAICAGG